MEPISEYEQERRNKRDKLRELGVDPYGGRVEGVQPLSEIKSSYKPEMGHDGGPVAKGAGRIMLKRDMGKLSFLTLRDDSGDLQVGLDKKRLDEKAWQVRDLLDLGDQIVVEGKLGQTNKGETTIWATQLSMASKALLPPPAKWEGLEDVELRYRQRYVDLWANPEVMRTMKLRTRVVEEIRAFLRGRGFIEVETPMMQIQPGGAAAKPFVTHHNALDTKLYMRIAPELFLKRLLVGGFTKVFELNRNFRNEGISPRHNPEFTMLEAYEAYGSWETMADLVEEMICSIAMNIFHTLEIVHENKTVCGTINLKRPWPRRAMADLVLEYAGWPFDKHPIQSWKPDYMAHIQRTVSPHVEKSWNRWRKNPDDGLHWFPDWLEGDLSSLEHKLKVTHDPAEQLMAVYESLVEPLLVDPCFVTRVPSVIIPLAKKCKDDPFFADVYELAINGVEISPGYSELNDPEIQAENFAHQVGDKDEQQKTDEDFLTALKYGMPPAGGMGLGIDRLLMMLTGAESIRDVILFPLMKMQER
jgi:lysyl-tRNA synthetase, class II